MRAWLISSAAAICIAVGKVSFEDCDRFTWSFGWIGSFEPTTPPSIWMARLETTSLVFILDWVPEPVCQTDKGKWSFHLPSATSSAAAAIASASRAGMLPRRLLARAADRLTIPSARMSGTGMASMPIGKLIRERAVCAPKSFSDGTSSGPKLSVSVRISLIRGGSLQRHGRGSMMVTVDSNVYHSHMSDQDDDAHRRGA